MYISDKAADDIRSELSGLFTVLATIADELGAIRRALEAGRKGDEASDG